MEIKSEEVQGIMFFLLFHGQWVRVGQMQRQFVCLNKTKHPLPNNPVFFIYLATRDFRVIVYLKNIG